MKPGRGRCCCYLQSQMKQISHFNAVSDAQASIYKDLAACDAICPIGICAGYLGCRLCRGAECTTPEAVFRGGRTCFISGPFLCQPAGAGLTGPQLAGTGQEDEDLAACNSKCSYGTCRSRVKCRACTADECAFPGAIPFGGKACMATGPYSCHEVRLFQNCTLFCRRSSCEAQAWVRDCAPL